MPTETITPTFVAVAVFVLVHLFVGRLQFLEGVPRSRWLSLAGGVAVAYVFLHILPELSSHQLTLETHAATSRIAFLEAEIYLVALAGLSSFYGLERYVRGSRAEVRACGQADEPERRVFWLHIGSFAIYNALIGYLLVHREQPGVWSLVFYTVAMALHFVTNDYGLRHDYKQAYDREARWIIAAAVVVGWLLGLFVEVSEIGLALLFAFLAGGVILNVLKEELPEERKSRFLPFLSGVVSYAALLMVAA
jgi:zinc transporter ZupT